MVLTTEKDGVRLVPHGLGDVPIAAVPLMVSIEPADRFRDWLLARLAARRLALERETTSAPRHLGTPAALHASTLARQQLPR